MVDDLLLTFCPMLLFFSAFQDINQQNFASTSSTAPDYGSDNTYDTSELGTPMQGRENNSEIGTEDLDLDQDLTTPVETLACSMSSDDTGLFMGGNILEKLEGFPRHKISARKESSLTGRDINNGNVSKFGLISGDRMDNPSETVYSRLAGHARKLSADSVGSDISSIQGSEVSNTGIANSLGDGSLEFGGDPEASTTDLQFPNDVQIVLPLDQRHKMNRVLLTMQRRLATAKTDMEDLIARLNQEIAVKDYLTTKVCSYSYLCS